jgi:hypothetical protein
MRRYRNYFIIGGIILVMAIGLFIAYQRENTIQTIPYKQSTVVVPPDPGGPPAIQSSPVPSGGSGSSASTAPVIISPTPDQSMNAQPTTSQPSPTPNAPGVPSPTGP